MMLGVFRFQPRIERFKFIHEPMVHRGRQHTKNQRSAQYTETDFDGLSTNFVLTSQNLNEMSEQPVIALAAIFYNRNVQPATSRVVLYGTPKHV